MQQQIKESEEEKSSLKKRIENYLNDGHNAHDEASRVSNFGLGLLTLDATCTSR